MNKQTNKKTPYTSWTAPITINQPFLTTFKFLGSINQGEKKKKKHVNPNSIFTVLKPVGEA